MKHPFLVAALSALATIATAQTQIETYSVYDVNHDANVTVLDVTPVVNHALTRSEAEPRVVGTAELNALLQQIDSRLAALEEANGISHPVTPAPATVASFAFAKKSIHVGETFTQKVQVSSDGTVSYFSSNPSVATVDAATGLVTAVADGETTIVATLTATATYPAASAAYTILVVSQNMLNGYEYVDLGLPSGLKWATCNVGATNPEDSGDFYAWGETETKDNYSQSNYLYYSTNTSVDADGFEDKSESWEYLGDNISGTQYDVARQKWGGDWRMPTRAEFNELLNNCSWKWGIKKGMNGYKVEGSNGNWIFLPAAGLHNGSILHYEGSGGYYWSATASSSSADYACELDFSISHHRTYYDRRYDGLSVRPVTE